VNTYIDVNEMKCVMVGAWGKVAGFLAAPALTAGKDCMGNINRINQSNIYFCDVSLETTVSFKSKI
jgi:hypothetical protein